jgi:hypothetical protein
MNPLSPFTEEQQTAIQVAADDIMRVLGARVDTMNAETCASLLLALAKSIADQENLDWQTIENNVDAAIECQRVH